MTDVDNQNLYIRRINLLQIKFSLERYFAEHSMAVKIPNDPKVLRLLYRPRIELELDPPFVSFFVNI